MSKSIRRTIKVDICKLCDFVIIKTDPIRSLVKCYSLDYDLEIAKAGRRVEFDIFMIYTVGERCTENDDEIQMKFSMERTSSLSLITRIQEGDIPFRN